MKKIITMLLALVMILSSAACGGKASIPTGLGVSHTGMYTGSE